MWMQRETSSYASVNRGESYRRALRFEIVETARIIGVVSDALGIPHVRFNLQITGPLGVAEEQRTLSLDSFRRLYCKPVSVVSG